MAEAEPALAKGVVLRRGAFHGIKRQYVSVRPFVFGGQVVEAGTVVNGLVPSWHLPQLWRRRHIGEAGSEWAEQSLALFAERNAKLALALAENLVTQKAERSAELAAAREAEEAALAGEAHEADGDEDAQEEAQDEDEEEPATSDQSEAAARPKRRRRRRRG